jgi:F-type H+-transporting ATPase subunit b
VRGKKWLTSLTVLLLSMILVLGLATTCYASDAVPPFPDFYKIGWTTVNFFILFALLYKYGYNPILRMLDQRSETIESSLKHAEDLRVEVEQMRKEAQTNLAESRKEAQEIVARATKMAEEAKDDIVAKAQQEAKNEKDKALAEIRAEREQAVTELRDTAATLAIMAAEKVLGRAIEEEDHKGMVQDFVKEAGDFLC